MSEYIKYSICMINLNMEDTIESSLRSILDQINENFEVIVCDGGSVDQSKTIIRALQTEYKNLRLIELVRDRKRKKGMDRNTSVKNAKGKYILLHLDCDDIYGRHIMDWVSCFHEIENRQRFDCLVSGRHINMLSKALFDQVGGYKNIEFEDRDLWMRLAQINRLIIWDHIDFVRRSPRNLMQKINKNTVEAYYAVYSDLTQGLSFSRLFFHYIHLLNIKFNKGQVIKLILLPLAYINSIMNKNFEKLHEFDPISFSIYLNNNRKKLDQLLNQKSSEISIKFINPLSYKIFNI